MRQSYGRHVPAGLIHFFKCEIKHWRAFPAYFGLQAAPVLEFKLGAPHFLSQGGLHHHDRPADYIRSSGLITPRPATLSTCV